MTKYRSHRTSFALITLLILLTAGCATVNLDSEVADTPERALELAASERDIVTAQRYLLRIASNFQDQDNHAAARQILRNQQLETIDSQLAGQKRLLSMASAVELQDSGWASELARDLSPDQFLGYPSDLMAKAAQLQAETFALDDDQLSAALTLMLLSQTDTQSNPQDTHNQTKMFHSMD